MGDTLEVLARLIQQAVALDFKLRPDEVVVTWDGDDLTLRPSVQLSQRPEVTALSREEVVRRITQVIAEVTGSPSFIFRVDARTLSNGEFAARMRHRREP
jgi:uncharacterized protein (DUF362 family)